MHEAKSLEHLEHNVSYQRLRKVPIPVTKVLLEKVLKVESHINKSLDIVHMYENYKWKRVSYFSYLAFIIW